MCFRNMYDCIFSLFSSFYEFYFKHHVKILGAFYKDLRYASRLRTDRPNTQTFLGIRIGVSKTRAYIDFRK